MNTKQWKCPFCFINSDSGRIRALCLQISLFFIFLWKPLRCTFFCQIYHLNFNSISLDGIYMENMYHALSMYVPKGLCAIHASYHVFSSSLSDCHQQRTKRSSTKKHSNELFSSFLKNCFSALIFIRLFNSWEVKPVYKKN